MAYWFNVKHNTELRWNIQMVLRKYISKGWTKIRLQNKITTQQEYHLSAANVQ